MPPIHISTENGPRASSHTWRSWHQVQAQTAGAAAEPSSPGRWQGMARNMGRSFCKRWGKKWSGRVQRHLSCFRQERLEAELCHLHPGSVTLGKLLTPLSLNFIIHKVGLLSRSSKIMCEKICMSFYYWQLRGGCAWRFTGLSFNPPTAQGQQSSLYNHFYCSGRPLRNQGSEGVSVLTAATCGVCGRMVMQT